MLSNCAMALDTFVSIQFLEIATPRVVCMGDIWKSSVTLCTATAFVFTCFS